MHRIERVLGRMREKRRLSEDRDEHGVGHDAREDRRDECFGLEVIAMKDLDGEERGAQRRPEDGGHARRGTGDEENAALPVGDAQVLAHDRADRAPHLHRGALATARSAEAERENRRETLEQRYATTDVPTTRVEGFDDRVGAPASRLGSVS